METLGRALAGQERGVALVHVVGQQRRRVGVGAGDNQRRHAADVRRQARGDEVRDGLPGGDEHLASHVAAFLLGG